MTHDNLQATLRHVDRHSPQDSDIFLAATAPHGGAAAPILSSPRDDRTLQLLRGWLESLAPVGPSAANVSVVPEETSTPELTVTQTQAPASASDDSGQSAATQPLSQFLKQRQPFTPRDSFDANIFNRRFFPDRFDEQSP